MEIKMKIKLNWKKIVAVLLVFLSTEHSVLALSVGISSSSITDTINRVEERYGFDKNILRRADQKTDAPKVEIYFANTNPKKGEMVTAQAMASGFKSKPESLYYTWFLYREGETDDQLEEAKKRAATIMAAGDFNPIFWYGDENYKDYNSATSDGDKDGFKAPVGGADGVGAKPVSSLSKDYQDRVGTDDYFEDPEAFKDPLRRTVATDRITRCFDHNFGSQFGSDNDENLNTNVGKDLIIECAHQFPGCDESFDSESLLCDLGDGEFGDEEEKQWKLDPANPDTDGDGIMDEADLLGLAQQTFTWKYQPGDRVGVIVEGLSNLGINEEVAEEQSAEAPFTEAEWLHMCKYGGDVYGSCVSGGVDNCKDDGCVKACYFQQYAPINGNTGDTFNGLENCNADCEEERSNAQEKAEQEFAKCVVESTSKGTDESTAKAECSFSATAIYDSGKISSLYQHCIDYCSKAFEDCNAIGKDVLEEILAKSEVENNANNPIAYDKIMWAMTGICSANDGTGCKREGFNYPKALDLSQQAKQNLKMNLSSSNSTPYIKINPNAGGDTEGSADNQNDESDEITITARSNGEAIEGSSLYFDWSIFLCEDSECNGLDGGNGTVVELTEKCTKEGESLGTCVMNFDGKGKYPEGYKEINGEKQPVYLSSNSRAEGLGADSITFKPLPGLLVDNADNLTMAVVVKTRRFKGDQMYAVSQFVFPIAKNKIDIQFFEVNVEKDQKTGEIVLVKGEDICNSGKYVDVCPFYPYQIVGAQIAGGLNGEMDKRSYNWKINNKSYNNPAGCKIKWDDGTEKDCFNGGGETDNFIIFPILDSNGQDGIVSVFGKDNQSEFGYERLYSVYPTTVKIKPYVFEDGSGKEIQFTELINEKNNQVFQTTTNPGVIDLVASVVPAYLDRGISATGDKIEGDINSNRFRFTWSINGKTTSEIEKSCYEKYAPLCQATENRPECCASSGVDELTNCCAMELVTYQEDIDDCSSFYQEQCGLDSDFDQCCPSAKEADGYDFSQCCQKNGCQSFYEEECAKDPKFSSVCTGNIEEICNVGTYPDNPLYIENPNDLKNRLIAVVPSQTEGGKLTGFNYNISAKVEQKFTNEERQILKKWWGVLPDSIVNSSEKKNVVVKYDQTAETPLSDLANNSKVKLFMASVLKNAPENIMFSLRLAIMVILAWSFLFGFSYFGGYNESVENRRRKY